MTSLQRIAMGHVLGAAVLQAAIAGPLGPSTAAQVRVNDLCSGAILLEDQVPLTFDTTAATDDNLPFTCFLDVHKDIWFTHTAVDTGALSISLCGSTFDTSIDIFRGTCGGLTLVDCNGNSQLQGCIHQSTVSFTPAAGVTYFIRVGGESGESGIGQIQLTRLPVNNRCSGAWPLALGVPATFDSSTATPSFPSVACGGFGQPDLWYRFTPQASGFFRASTCGSSFDTTLDGWRDLTCPAGTGRSLGCNDDSCGLQSELYFAGVAGEEIWLRVAGSSGATGIGTLRVDGYLAPVTTVCTGEQNSRGRGASVIATGSDSLADNDLVLEVVDLPVTAFGLFVASQTPGMVMPMNSDGVLCLGGAIGRYGHIVSSGPLGRFSLTVDNTSIPRPTGTAAAAAGATWYFTSWYRDGGTSNFSDAVEVIWN